MDSPILPIVLIPALSVVLVSGIIMFCKFKRRRRAQNAAIRAIREKNRNRIDQLNLSTHKLARSTTITTLRSTAPRDNNHGSSHHHYLRSNHSTDNSNGMGLLDDEALGNSLKRRDNTFDALVASPKRSYNPKAYPSIPLYDDLENMMRMEEYKPPGPQYHHRQYIHSQFQYDSDESRDLESYTSESPSTVSTVVPPPPPFLQTKPQMGGRVRRSKPIHLPFHTTQAPTGQTSTAEPPATQPPQQPVPIPTINNHHHHHGHHHHGHERIIVSSRIDIPNPPPQQPLPPAPSGATAVTGASVRRSPSLASTTVSRSNSEVSSGKSPRMKSAPFPFPLPPPMTNQALPAPPSNKNNNGAGLSPSLSNASTSSTTRRPSPTPPPARPAPLIVTPLAVPPSTPSAPATATRSTTNNNNASNYGLPSPSFSEASTAVPLTPQSTHATVYSTAAGLSSPTASSVSSPPFGAAVTSNNNNGPVFPPRNTSRKYVSGQIFIPQPGDLSLPASSSTITASGPGKVLISRDLSVKASMIGGGMDSTIGGGVGSSRRRGGGEDRTIVMESMSRKSEEVSAVNPFSTRGKKSVAVVPLSPLTPSSPTSPTTAATMSSILAEYTLPPKQSHRPQQQQQRQGNNPQEGSGYGTRLSQFNYD